MIQCCPCLCPGDKGLELRVESHNRGHECAAAYHIVGVCHSNIDHLQNYAMGKACCAECDRSRTNKEQRVVDSTCSIVQSRKAGYSVICRDVDAISPRIR